MKRVFAHIGFSSCLTLFALNIFGIVFARYLCLALVALYIIILISPNHRKVAPVTVCLGAALFSCLIFMYCYSFIAEPQLELSGKSAKAVFYFTGLCEQKGNSFVYTAKTQKIFLNGAPQVVRFKLYTKDQIPASAYQLLEGKLNFSATGYDGFSSYGAWGKGEFLRASVESFERSDTLINPVMRRVVQIRYDIIITLSNLIGGDEGSLAGALVVGSKNRISTEIIDAFKIAGAAHLTAVSGLHLSVVTGSFAFLFKKLRLNGRVSYVLLIIIVVSFCMLSDFSKSVLRAGIMMVILFSGMLFKRRADALNSLGAALFFICLNPFAVCDLGTVLSGVCILALIASSRITSSAYKTKIYKRIVKLCYGKAVRFKLLNLFMRFAFEPLVASVSIITCTVPVMYLFFDYLSLAGLVLNVIIVPLGSVAVVLSMLTYVLSRVRVAGALIAFVTRLVLSFVIVLVKWASGFRFACVSFSAGVGIVIAATIIIIGICVAIAPNAVKKISVGAVAFAALFCLNAYDTNCCHIFVSDGSAVVLSTKNSVCVVNVDDSSDYYGVKNYLLHSGRKIDLLVGDNNEYAKRLTDECKCEKRAKSVNKKRLDDDLILSAEKGELYAALGGVNVGTSNGDIVINGKQIKDKKGTISLKNGSVIYTVDGSDYFASRSASELLTE